MSTFRNSRNSLTVVRTSHCLLTVPTETQEVWKKTKNPLGKFVKFAKKKQNKFVKICKGKMCKKVTLRKSSTLAALEGLELSEDGPRMSRVLSFERSSIDMQEIRKSVSCAAFVISSITSDDSDVAASRLTSLDIYELEHQKFGMNNQDCLINRCTSV